MQHDSDDPPSLSPLSDVMEEEEEDYDETSEEIVEEIIEEVIEERRSTPTRSGGGGFIPDMTTTQPYLLTQDIGDDSEEFEEFERMIASEYVSQPEQAGNPSLIPQGLHVEAVDVKQLSTRGSSSSSDNSQVSSLASEEEGVSSRGVALRGNPVVHVYEYDSDEDSAEYIEDSAGFEGSTPASDEDVSYYNEERGEYQDEYQIPLSLTEMEETDLRKNRKDAGNDKHEEKDDEELVRITATNPAPQIRVQDCSISPPIMQHHSAAKPLHRTSNCSDEEKIKAELNSRIKNIKHFNVECLDLNKQGNTGGKVAYDVRIQLSKDVNSNPLEYSDNSMSLTSAASMGKLADNLEKLPQCQHRDQVFRIIDKLATCMNYLTDINKEYRMEQTMERNRLYGSIDYMPYYTTDRSNRCLRKCGSSRCLGVCHEGRLSPNPRNQYDTDRASPIHRRRNSLTSEDELFFVQQQARRRRHSMVEMPVSSDLPSPNPNDTLEDQIKQCLYNTTSLETLLTINNPQPLSTNKELSKSLPNMNFKSKEDLSLSTIESKSKSSSIEQHKRSTDSSEKCTTRDASTHTDTQSSILLGLAENDDETGRKAKAKLREVKRIEKELEACVKLSESLEDMIIDYVEKKDTENVGRLGWKSLSMPDISHKRHPMYAGCGLSSPALNQPSPMNHHMNFKGLKKPRHRKLYPNFDDTSSDSYKKMKSNIKRKSSLRSDLSLDLSRTRSLSSSATASSSASASLRDGFRSPELFKMVRFRKHAGPVNTNVSPHSTATDSDYSEKNSAPATPLETESYTDEFHEEMSQEVVVVLSQDEDETTPEFVSSNIADDAVKHKILPSTKPKETQVTPTLYKPFTLETQTKDPYTTTVETQMTPVGISNQSIQVPDDQTSSESTTTHHTSDSDRKDDSCPSTDPKHLEYKSNPSKLTKNTVNQTGVQPNFKGKGVKRDHSSDTGSSRATHANTAPNKHATTQENPNSYIDKTSEASSEEGTETGTISSPNYPMNTSQISYPYPYEPTDDNITHANTTLLEANNKAPQYKDNVLPNVQADRRPQNLHQNGQIDPNVPDSSNVYPYPTEKNTSPDDRDGIYFQNPLNKGVPLPNFPNNRNQMMPSNTYSPADPNAIEDQNYPGPDDDPQVKDTYVPNYSRDVPASLSQAGGYTGSTSNNPTTSSTPRQYAQRPHQSPGDRKARTPVNYSEPFKFTSGPYESSDYPTSSQTMDKPYPNEVTDPYFNTSLFSNQTAPQNTPVSADPQPPHSMKLPNNFVALIPHQGSDGSDSYVACPTAGILLPHSFMPYRVAPSQPQTTETQTTLEDYFQPWSKYWKSFKDTASQTPSSEKSKTGTPMKTESDESLTSKSSKTPFSTSEEQYEVAVDQTSGKVSLQSKPVSTTKPPSRHYYGKKIPYMKCENCSGLTNYRDRHCHSAVRVCKKHNAVMLKQGEKHVYALNKDGRKLACARSSATVQHPRPEHQNNDLRYLKTLTYYVNDTHNEWPKNRQVRDVRPCKLRPDTPGRHYTGSYDDEYDSEETSENADPTLNFSTNFHTSSPERNDCSTGGVVSEDENNEDEKHVNFMIGVQKTDLVRLKKRDEYNHIHDILRNMNVSQKRCLNIIKEIRHNK